MDRAYFQMFPAAFCLQVFLIGPLSDEYSGFALLEHSAGDYPDSEIEKSYTPCRKYQCF